MTAKLHPVQGKNKLPAHVLRKASVTFKPTSTAANSTGQAHADDRAAQISLVRQRKAAKFDYEAMYAKAYKRSTYSGAELQPYTGRPGSLDFLALPSLIGDQRVYRRDHIIKLNREFVAELQKAKS